MLPKDDAGWTPCSEGALSSTIERVRSKRRQTNILRFGASTLAGTLVLVLVSVYFSPNSVDVDCRHVVSLLADYVSGSLDKENRKTVERHLASCEKCRKKIEEMQAGEMALQTVVTLPASVFQENLILSAIQTMPIAID